MMPFVLGLTVLLLFALGGPESDSSPAEANDMASGPEASCRSLRKCNLQLGTDEAAQELADRYAPIVNLKEQSAPCDDSGDPYFPTQVESAYEQPGVRLRGRTEDGERVSTEDFTVEDLDGLDRAWHLDFPGNPIRPGCGYEQRFRALVESLDLRQVAYAHIAREEGEDGIALQYWFWYYFNDWNNHHEGDWEMIQIEWDDADSVEEALQTDPSSVAYSQHGTGETRDWTDDKLDKEGDHPVVWAASGSHASFLDSAVYLGLGEQGAGFGCDDATGDSFRVETEAIVIPTTTEGALPELAWVGFGGRWGEPAGREFNGPTGPIDKQRYTEPMSWQDGLPSTSIKLPTSTFGPNAIDIFCAGVAFFSDTLLLVITASPAIGLAILGGIMVGAVFLATRTTYRPPLSLPLARRRRLGQILTSSLSIYLRSPLLFLALGAVFIPLGLLLSAVHALVLEARAVEDGVRFFDSNLVPASLSALR